ncbi:MAG: hydrolase glyoxylase [Bacteroidetes bacterium]|nr:MAG: hydrolase glyoxylase [Bacteroidota bacterium]
MKKKVVIFIVFLCLHSGIYSQSSNTYEVYAIQFGQPWFAKASEAAVGAPDKDSIEGCNIFWLLKGREKIILVDAGFLINEYTNADHYWDSHNYTRPDSALIRMNIPASAVTDIIITHPHSDHIGGIGLFPKATIWMQQDDYNYFVGAAWQKNGRSDGFDKRDVQQIVSVNVEGRLHLVKGDSIEIMPGIRVFIGSKHTWESQYVLVNTSTDKVLIASDNIWYYYNLDHMLPITYTFDPSAYVQQMKRMKILQPNTSLIIPGHDAIIFSRFPEVAKGIVKIR